MQFFLTVLESGDLSFLIREMRDEVILKTLTVDVVLKRTLELTAKQVIDWSNDLSFARLCTYCLKGRLEALQHWAYMVDLQMIRDTPSKSRVPKRELFSIYYRTRISFH